MGSVHSSISSEAAITAVLIAGAVGLGYYTKPSVLELVGGKKSPSGPPSEKQTSVSGGTAKKGKKKTAKSAAAAPKEAQPSLSSPVAPEASAQETKTNAASTSIIIPGSLDDLEKSVPPPAAQPTKSKKSSKSSKKKKVKAAPAVPEKPHPARDHDSDSSLSDQQPPKPVAPAPKAKQRRSIQPAAESSSSVPPLTKPEKLSSLSLDTDGSWTRVETRSNRRRRSTPTDTDPAAHSATGSNIHVTSLDAAASADQDGRERPSVEIPTSDAGIATPITGNSSPIIERTSTAEEDDENIVYKSRDYAENRKTLAEKLLPKTRKTVVDDMLEQPDQPSIARVMRVRPLPNEKPATGFSWGDYEDVDAAGGGSEADKEDDGWGIVKSRRPNRTHNASSNTQSQATVQKASETLTKKQRQNASKREAQKAAKTEAEAQRMANLAKHRRELEGERVTEQASGRAGKTVSGGMKATVDENGKLVWE